MDKDKINSKIEDLEAELQKLKQLANEPEQRTPEFGDVWEDSEGFVEFIAKGGKGVDLISGYISFKKYDQYQAHSSNTYLGKHSEVYVKIADVRAALSHKDVDGEDMFDYFNQEFKSEVQYYGAGESFKALRKLNIITD
jgi:hypothetical protein